MNKFLQDVIAGLSSPQKHLSSKYFYDEKGDELFMKIMRCPEYYLTRCEMEIFTGQTKEMVEKLTENSASFDVVELGAGDATKSVHLLKELQNNGISYTYFPIDISTNVISLLQNNLPGEIPGIEITGLNGEYFPMLEKVKTLSAKPKVVLFLGSNIGNVKPEQAVEFCKELRSHLNPGDLMLTGFDLKKEPAFIRAAYNDKDGFTRDFNINLLHRINKELGGNFEVNDFTHWPIYDPSAGSCKSYLVSLKKQQVTISGHPIFFDAFETIFMEISQKYTVLETEKLAIACDFKPLHHFFDTKNWFLDALWKSV